MSVADSNGDITGGTTIRFTCQPVGPTTLTYNSLYKRFSVSLHPPTHPHSVPRECPRLLINMEKVGQVSVLYFIALLPITPSLYQTDPLMLLMGMGAGFDFNEATSYRDVFEQGTCDDGVRKLASMLGWEVSRDRMGCTQQACIHIYTLAIR